MRRLVARLDADRRRPVARDLHLSRTELVELLQVLELVPSDELCRGVEDLAGVAVVAASTVERPITEIPASANANPPG